MTTIILVMHYDRIKNYIVPRQAKPDDFVIFLMNLYKKIILLYTYVYI